MYRKLAALTFLSSTLLPSIAPGQGSETKQLSPITSINIIKNGKVILTQENAHTLKVEPPDKSEDVKATVKGNTLTLDAPSGSTLYVSMKDIEGLAIGGNGSIIGASAVKTENLQLSVSGSGKIELKDVDAKNINTEISGVGKMTLSGKSERLGVSISGSGKIDAAGLKTTDCKAEISGVGKCTVDVTDNLDVSISGSGSVNYVNQPKNLSKDISGSGKIQGADTNEGTGSDTTTVHWGKKKIVISDDDDDDWEKSWEKAWEKSWEEKFPFGEKKKNRGRNKPSWPGLELGVNGYLDADYSTTLPQGLQYLDLDYGKSIAFSINFFDARKKFFDRHLFLFTGLGVTWNNYHFDNNITLQPGSTTVLASFDSTSYSKNKITASYLIAPAMAEYFFGDRRYRSFHIAAGFLLGYKLGSHTKQKYESGGGTAKTKVYDDFNLNPFRASIRVSLGYGRVNIFADRALTTFFEKDKGPILYPFTAGIGVSYF